MPIGRKINILALLIPPLYDCVVACSGHTSVAGTSEANVAVQDPILREMFSYSLGRASFVTDEGRLGLGPPGVQQGDIVAVLLRLSLKHRSSGKLRRVPTMLSVKASCVLWRTRRVYLIRCRLAGPCSIRLVWVATKLFSISKRSVV